MNLLNDILSYSLITLNQDCFAKNFLMNWLKKSIIFREQLAKQLIMEVLEYLSIFSYNSHSFIVFYQNNVTRLYQCLV